MNTLSVTFTPTDTSDYTTATATTTITVFQATPTITWNSPAPIVYGTALGSSQLNATANVPGTFSYTPAAGAILRAGVNTLSVTFTPTDTSDYTTATATTTITVFQATPTITWNSPAPIVYGTALGSSQLNATANVPGTFSYTPAAGAILRAGVNTLSVTFTPTDTSDYTTATATTTITVFQATPTITWNSPAPIVYGTALGSSQLNATANVPGTFSYTPAAGAILRAGVNTLSVTFTPTDTSDYTTATATTTITITWETFISSDTTTQGNWQGRYGTDGYDIIGNQANLPTYATVTPAGQSNWTWASSTTDTRGLQIPQSGSTTRTAACWYSSGQFTVDINLTDGQSHTVSLYALDWDSNSRSERVDVIDPNSGAVLDSQTLSSFNGGTYLSWSLKGHVQLRFTTLGGANAVVSGIFFGTPATPPSPSATFISSDTTTQGNWQGRYGSDGYDIIGNQANLPTYATVTPAGQSNWTWASSTTDTRGLLVPQSGSTTRTAACWYSNSGQFTVDINLTDGQAHRVAIYACDWDSTRRSERIDVVDPTTHAVLDSRTVSSFHGGVYLSWQLKGHVQLVFNRLSGANPVVSGLFFG